MMRTTLLGRCVYKAGGVLMAFALFTLPGMAQETDPSLQNDFCDDTDPANQCDDPATCKCSDDNIMMSFDGLEPTENVLVIDEATDTDGMRITSVLYATTVSPMIQGWSLAVKHNPDDLAIGDEEEDLTLDGTNAGDALGTPFIQNKVVASDVNGETLHGYISAVVLDIVTLDKFLPIQTNSIMRATYTAQRNFAAGDEIPLQFSNNELRVPNSPAVEINFTDNGLSRAPRLLTDSKIRKGGGGGQMCTEPENALYFGDTATTDVVAVGAGTEYSISSRNQSILGFQLAVKASGAGPTTWDFANDIGGNENIDPVYTAEDGTSVSPDLQNSATSDVGTVQSVARGSALTPFQDPDGDGVDNDFFGVDLGPFAGGDTGFTVGYAADLDADPNNAIPATGDEASCPVNELLVVTLGEPKAEDNFIRGDADGNDRINISDGIIIIQTAVGNFNEAGLTSRFGFYCEDAYDANDDGSVAIGDAIPVLQYVFLRGNPLSAPFRQCGADPTGDALSCTSTPDVCP